MGEIKIKINSRPERTREREKDEPIYDQHWPKHGDIKHAEPRAKEADGDSPSSGMPELELGQPPDEGTELLVLLSRERARPAGLELIVLFERRVEFRGQKGEEEVEKVDAERVADWVDSELDTEKRGWRIWRVDLPIYQPWDTRILAMKIRSRKAVLAHL